MKKVSLFFGAGAEMSYGLPSGGKFALDIFRENTAKDKVIVKNQLNSVNTQSYYAKWLPNDFQSKKLTAFTKGQYESLVKGSLENRRDSIIEYMKNFDSNVEDIVDNIQYKSNIDLDEVFRKILGVDIGTFNYEKDIELNKILGSDINHIFATKYFSAFLKLVEIEEVSNEFRRLIKNITRTILELLIGSLGEDLIHRLNDGIFDKSPDTIDFFDDLGAIFTLDYSNSGMRGLEILIENEFEDLDSLENNEDIIIQFGVRVLEDIFSRALDYQTLIDTNWRYIYSPKTDWGKFSKIMIFLHTVKRYIQTIADENEESILNGNGYYHDILELEKEYDIVGIGTTNYNSFIETITKKDVYYLNGSVKDYYDPYLNKIVSEEENENKKHIVVPFLFTQSGIKPLTSVKMSERYVNLFNRFKESDIICVCGFSFSSDDGHINGMFRELIEDHDKTVTILEYCNNDNFKVRQVKDKYKEKLRLESTKNLNIIPVNKNRANMTNDIIWYKSL